MESVVKFVLFVLVVSIIYTVAYVFDLLPNSFQPYNLFPEQYVQLDTALANSTGMGKKIHDYMLNKQTSNEEKKKAEDEKAKAEAAAHPDPLTKAKASVQNYEQKLQEEKKELDSL